MKQKLKMQSITKELQGSKIVTILGKRGSGKTSFAFKTLEDLHAIDESRPMYALSWPKDNLPSFVQNIETIEDANGGGVVVIDEAYLHADSRRSSSAKNVGISHLIGVSRHNDLSLIFITLSTSRLDKRVKEDTDIWCLKQLNLYSQIEGDKFVQGLYKGIDSKTLQDGNIYVRSEDLNGLLHYDLPSFWSQGLSKSFGKTNEQQPQQRQQSGSILGLVGGALLSLLNSKPSSVKTGQAAKSGFNWSYDSKTNKFNWSHH